MCHVEVLPKDLDDMSAEARKTAMVDMVTKFELTATQEEADAMDSFCTAWICPGDVT